MPLAVPVGSPANQLLLVASLMEREPLRYTPAGVPVIQCLLQHASAVVEAGIERQVEFEMPAIALGEISGHISALPLGEHRCLSGFLTRKSRNSKSLVFHITGCSEVPKD